MFQTNYAPCLIGLFGKKHNGREIVNATVIDESLRDFYRLTKEKKHI